ncbi:MAG: hypothetical protein QM723_36845 [Myxococcaceae bacterium]
MVKLSVLGILLLLFLPGRAGATLAPTSLELLAHTADLMVIATGEPSVVRGDLGQLKVERTLKGGRVDHIRVLAPSDESECDTSKVAPERALYFLSKHKDGYVIMGGGSGALPISKGDATVDLSEFVLSAPVEKACGTGSCPLDVVLRELRSFYSGKKALAFILRFERGSHHTEVQPLAAVHCAQHDADDHATWTGCTVGAAKGGAASFSGGDLVCLSPPDGTISCWRDEPATPAKQL